MPNNALILTQAEDAPGDRHVILLDRFAIGRWQDNRARKKAKSL